MALTTSYRITIDATGAGGAAPADGFIDATTIEQYMAAGSSPTTYAQSQAKERANIRFGFLQEQLQLDANVYIRDITATGANATTAATSFVFTADIERGDGVLSTRDEENAGTMLADINAIKRWVARALIETRTCFGDIYDPTQVAGYGQGTTATARMGIRTEKVTVGALAANLTAATALVTVTKL